MNVGVRGIEHGLMPSIDWLSVSLGELVQRLIGVTSAGGEHCPRSR